MEPNILNPSQTPLRLAAEEGDLQAVRNLVLNDKVSLEVRYQNPPHMHTHAHTNIHYVLVDGIRGGLLVLKKKGFFFRTRTQMEELPFSSLPERDTWIL